jgi:hypothetical protein
VADLVILILVYGLLTVSGLLLFYCYLSNLGPGELVQHALRRWQARNFYEGIDLRTEVQEARERKRPD